MKWYKQNPELARPLAVCLLLVAGAVLAEAVVQPGAVEEKQVAEKIADNVAYEMQVNLARKQDVGAAPLSPYFDQDDPAE